MTASRNSEKEIERASANPRVGPSRRFSMDKFYHQSSFALEKMRRFPFRMTQSIVQGMGRLVKDDGRKQRVKHSRKNDNNKDNNRKIDNNQIPVKEKKYRGFDFLPCEIIFCIFSYLLDLNINFLYCNYSQDSISNNIVEFQPFYINRGLKQQYIQANNLLSIRSVSKSWRNWTNQSITSLRTRAITSNLTKEMIEANLLKARKFSVDTLNPNPIKYFNLHSEVFFEKDNTKKIAYYGNKEYYYHLNQIQDEDKLFTYDKSSTRSIFHEKLNFLGMLTQCQNLINISFRNLELLVDDDLKLISNLLFLQSLNIGGCIHITDKGTYNLCFSRREMTSKSQNNHQLYHQHIQYIEEIKGTPLSQRNFFIQQVAHQTNRMTLPNLKYLNISMTQVSDNSFDFFTESKIGKNLHSLTLYGVNFISEGKICSFLKEAKKLSSLNIRGVKSLSPQESLRIKVFGKTKKIPVSCTVLIGPPIENSVYSRY